MTVMDKIRVRDGPKGKSASGGQSKIANPRIANPGLPIQDCQSKVANPKDKSFEGLEQTGDTGQTIDQGQKEDFLVKE